MDVLSTLKPGFFVVVYANHTTRDEISHIIMELALRCPVTVLDGGNHFQAYRISQLLRQRTVDVSTAANRLFIQRAFTCYQMLALLENAPSLRQPYMVLDLLATFYDEHTSTQEAHRLLIACIRQIHRLCQFAPVAVTLGPPLLKERAFLIEKVCKLADTILMEEMPIPQEMQPTLF